jgi:cobalt-zinc-cadmium efflux system outer membrane protein
VVEYQRERAEASIASARRLRFPDIGLGLNYTQTGTGSNAVQPPTLTVGLTATLPVLYRYRGEITRAEADYRTTSVQRAKTEAQVLSDVEGAFTAFSYSRRLVERMEGRLLERAKRTLELVQIQYSKGAASLLEFLDAQRTYIAVNVEYLQDLANYWTAVFQLEQAVGMELRK